jgi:transposase
MFSAANNGQSNEESVHLESIPLPAQLPTDQQQLQQLLAQQRQQDYQCFANVISRVQAQVREHELALKQVHDQIDEIVHARVQTETIALFKQLLEEQALARRRMFGASSEQSQARLFDEAETVATTAEVVTDEHVDASTDSDTAAAQNNSTAKESLPAKARGKRSPLPASLPRVEVVHDVPVDQRLCDCGTPMVEIGREVSEQLDIVPMQVRVLQHIRIRYGCPGSGHQVKPAPVLAPLPPQPLPKSLASASVLAMLLAVKYVDGLPLARFEYVLQRHGITVPRQTLARWVIASAQLLQPLFNVLRDTLLEGKLIHMDETPIQVLKPPKHKPDKPPTSSSYMWVQTGGVPGKAVTLYDYDPSRSGEVPKRLLADWHGCLMTDGYAGYNAVVKEQGIMHLVCWAHARRGFVEALAVQPKHAKGKDSLAAQAINTIAKLYKTEKDGKELIADQRHRLRQEQAKPILNEFKQWLQTHQPLIPPQSTLGKAMAYTQTYWNQLTGYLEAGHLPIDNNVCENAIRPFVIGRKAWLFSDTPAGANASAMIYSLVQSAKANHQEPYEWLRYVIAKLS